MNPGVFVGRTRELAALDAAYRDENVNLVLVSGDAGIGKTRLVREFIARLNEDPQVFMGRCLEFGNDGMPYAPFVPMLRALLPAARINDRVTLFGDILIALEQAADERPIVLVLEDLHWSDRSSQELLAFLAANLSHPAIRLIGTHRPLTKSLRQLVAELTRSPAVRQVSPAPLTRHEVGRKLATWLKREPEPDVVTDVFARSQGNPLFVEALSDSPHGTPGALQELLLAGLAPLTTAARDVLSIASVIGAVVDHDILVAASAVAEPDLLSALRDLIDERLLEVADDGYAFRHELIRRAVYEALLPAERTRLHTALAEILRDDERRVAQLAAHAFAAGNRPLALEAAWRASAAAADSAAEAERLNLLRRVLELWGDVDEPEPIVGVSRVTVLDQAVEACIATNAIQSGLTWSAEALSVAEDPARYLRHARLKNAAGLGGEADLSRALSLTPREPHLLRGHIFAELAAFHVFVGNANDAQAHAREALEIAEAVGDRTLVAQAHAYLGLAAALADPGLADSHFVAARSAADPRTLTTVATWEASVRIANGEFDVALKVIEEGIGAARQVYHSPKDCPILVVKWVQALGGLDRWDEALEIVDDMLGEAELPALSRAALLVSQAEGKLARDDRGAASDAVRAAEELLGDQPWVRPYRLKVRAMQVRLEPDRAADIYAAAVADGLDANPHEAWALVAAAKPRHLPPLSVVGSADAAHRAEALGESRPMPRPQARKRREGALGLTPRELDVLRLVAEGKSNRQIAQTLFISGNTAGVHVSRILAKLGAATRTEAARKFLDASVA